MNLDHASSMPLLPEVKAAMAAALESLGNSSSIHQAGRQAKAALERARGQVAALLHAKPEEISFTSCGTESNNLFAKAAEAAH